MKNNSSKSRWFVSLLLVLSLMLAGASAMAEENMAFRLDAGVMGSSTDYSWARFTLPEGALTGSNYTISYDYLNTAEAAGRINYTLFKADGTISGAVGPQHGIVDAGVRPGSDYNIRYNGGAFYPMENLAAWNHIEFQVSGNDFAMYVNGTKVVGSSFDASAIGVMKNIILGGLYQGTGGTGYFDNFVIAQDGQTVYEQTFDSVTVEDLAAEGWQIASGGAGSGTIVPGGEDAVPKPKANDVIGGIFGTSGVSDYAMVIDAGEKGSSLDHAWARLVLKSANLPTSGTYTVSFDYLNTAATDGRVNFTVWKADGTLSGAVGPQHGIVDAGSRPDADYNFRYNGGMYYPAEDLTEWNHVEFKVDGDNFTMYLNGEEVAGNTFNADAVGVMKNLLLGGSYQGTGGTGYFDNMTITNGDGTIAYAQDFADGSLAILTDEGWTFSYGSMREDWIAAGRGGDIYFVPTEMEEAVWYPHNTVCVLGTAFKDVAPDLTSKWYNFVEMDLSVEGTHVYQLCASDKYIIGYVIVEVNGDTVNVRWQRAYEGYGDGNVWVESEFVTFLPDVDTLTSVETADLTNFGFGTDISIANDLNGDTDVLLYVNNVVTYCNYAINNSDVTTVYPLK